MSAIRGTRTITTKEVVEPPDEGVGDGADIPAGTPLLETGAELVPSAGRLARLAHHIMDQSADTGLRWLSPQLYGLAWYLLFGAGMLAGMGICEIRDDPRIEGPCFSVDFGPVIFYILQAIMLLQSTCHITEFHTLTHWEFYLGWLAGLALPLQMAWHQSRLAQVRTRARPRPR